MCMLLERVLSADGLSGFAVWHITETEEELLSLLPSDVDFSEIMRAKSKARRLERLAVRALLAQTLGREHVIKNLRSGRPVLVDGSWHISVSHTSEWAALAWSKQQGVGVDIERRSNRVLRVTSRFINESEREAAQTFGNLPSPEYELLMWAAKESMYKLLDRRGLDLLHSVQVIPDGAISERGACSVRVEGEAGNFPLLYRFHPEYVLAVVGTSVSQV